MEVEVHGSKDIPKSDEEIRLTIITCCDINGARQFAEMIAGDLELGYCDLETTAHNAIADFNHDHDLPQVITADDDDELINLRLNLIIDMAEYCNKNNSEVVASIGHIASDVNKLNHDDLLKCGVQIMFLYSKEFIKSRSDIDFESNFMKNVDIPPNKVINHIKELLEEYSN